MMALIVLTLSAPVWNYKLKQSNLVVFCVDISKSISLEERNKQKKLFSNWQQKIKKIHDVRYVVFGENVSFYDNLPEKLPFEKTSNITEGLEAALAIILKDKKPGKVLLFTDGSQQKILSETIQKYRDYQIPIFVKAPASRNKEFYLDEVKVPLKVYLQQKINFSFLYRSNFNGKIKVRILSNNIPYLLQTLVVKKGQHILEIEGDALDAGEYLFQVKINGDERLENNIGYTTTTVLDKIKVAILGSVANEYLAESLKLYNMDVFYDQYATCDGVIVPDPETISSKDKLFLFDYVSNGGNILWMGKGEAAWLPGKHIPTKKLPKPKKDKPPKNIPKSKPDKDNPVKIEARSAAFVFIIDRSESMQGEKLELAQLSALETITRLWIKDQIGVIAFDIEPSWILPLGPVVDFKWAQNRLLQISSEGGGTIIKSALQMAYQKLRKTPVHVKHIILLSDGVGDFRSRGTIVDLTKKMKRHNISITTIGIGKILDGQLLAAIAREGAGKFYITEDHTNIRSLVIKDVDRLLKIRGPVPKEKTLKIKELPFLPSITPPKPQPRKKEEKAKFYEVKKNKRFVTLKKFNTFPPIEKYEQYLAKKGSQKELFIVGNKDPLLLQWNWKSGNVMLWAGIYKDWQYWNKYPQFWATILYSLLSKNINQPQATMEVDEYSNDYAHVKLTIVPPQNVTIHSKYTFIKKSPIHWYASMPTNTEPELIRAIIKKKKHRISSAFTVQVKAYIKEFADLKVNEKMLQTIASSTQGEVIDNNINSLLQQTYKDAHEKLENYILWFVLFLAFILIFLAMKK